MPPKKINKTVKQTVQVKTPRRRLKRQKCSSNIETEESIKTPDLNFTNVKDDDQKKERVIILNKNDINIMLANEVVGRQFPKKSTLLKEPVNKAVLDVLKQPKSKPVLKRKRPLKNNVVPNGETLASPEVPPQKIVRRRLVPKKLRNSPITIQNSVSPKGANESVQPPVKNLTKRVRKNKQAMPKQDQVEDNVAIQNSTDTPKPKTPRRKLSLNRKTPISRPRTRRQSRTVSKEIEPAPNPENVPITQNENNEIVDTTNVIKDQDIILRRNSLASLSELSWTKDISSSSTTTFATVSSKDFFRIDNKIPIIKLTNIDQKLKSEENNNICKKKDNKLQPIQTIAIQFENSLCEKSAIETCDKYNDKDSDSEIDLPCPFASNLSSSSSESCSDLEKSDQSAPTPVNKINDILEKVSSKLKSFDLEIINWIGYSNENANPNIEKIHEKLLEHNFLKEEMNLIVKSKKIIRILSGNNEKEKIAAVDKSNENLQTGGENNANLSLSKSINHPYDDKRNTFEEKDCVEEYNDILDKSDKKDVAINKATDNTYDDDEDDALSLYAESITGIESSTNNSKVDWDDEHPDFEEYIPQPLPKSAAKPPEKITYQPTKIITTQVEQKDDGLNNVCEKQNADSTSVYREKDNDNSLEENNVIFEDRLGNFKEPSIVNNSVTKLIHQAPVLMGSIYKPMTGVTSVVFKGVCFYNLISNCKKNACKFPHILLEVDDIKKRLKKISDTTFIQEYMLVRVWPGLRWKYGMTFVEEGIERKLTKIVVEMALDFITKVTNKITIIDVVENILLYLNNVNMSVCEDLLNYNIKSKNIVLCDFFINTIAESQNFSRFKSVFVNLTEFMYRVGRTFSEGVAVHVLERVVILPYDEGLARALLKIIRNTKASIFTNSMIGILEQQLLSSNVELYEEFCSLKNQAFSSQTVLGNCYPDPSLQNSDVDRLNVNPNHLDKDKRYSPDTTNLDHLNKTTVEPKFTRTIDVTKLNFLNLNGRLTTSSSSDSEDKRYTPKNNFKSWRGRKSFRGTNNARLMQRNQTMRPPLRPPYKRRSDQTFGGSPSKFPHRNGTNFFNDFS